MSEDRPTVSAGMDVFDGDGERIGTVRGITDDGFVVTTRDGVDALSIEHERAGHEVGEAELIWRCLDCGEVGDIHELPDECPSCGAPKEDIYYWIED